MTDEQEIAIERLNRFKTIEVLYGTFAMTSGQLERLKEAIEVVLNMLKEKDKEIIKLSERANEYKKAITCKDCDCSICQAHINNLKLREENELAKEQLEKQNREIEELEKIVDRLTDEQEEREKYVHNLERRIESAKIGLKKQCEIADERNDLLVKVNKLEKQVELMAEAFKQDDARSVEEIIEYFKSKAKEE